MSDRKKILVVEDELQFAKIIKMRLSAEGYNVTIASDAYSGTKEIINGDPDLIILDLMMPAGGGLLILDRIKLIPSKSMIPVVILTGSHLTDSIMKKAGELGVSAVFSKTCKNDVFMKKIKSLVPLP